MSFQSQNTHLKMSSHLEIMVITSCSWVIWLVDWVTCFQMTNLSICLDEGLLAGQPFAKCKQMRSETPYFTSIVIVYQTISWPVTEVGLNCNRITLLLLRMHILTNFKFRPEVILETKEKSKLHAFPLKYLLICCIIDIDHQSKQHSLIHLVYKIRNGKESV